MLNHRRFCKISIPLAVSLLALASCVSAPSLPNRTGGYPESVRHEHRSIDITSVTPVVPGAGTSGIPTVTSPHPQGPSERAIRIAVWNRTNSPLYLYSGIGLQPSGYSNGEDFLPVPVPPPTYTIRAGEMKRIGGVVFGGAGDMLMSCLRTDMDALGVCHPLGVSLGQIPGAPFWLLENAYGGGFQGPSIQSSIVRLTPGSSPVRTVKIPSPQDRPVRIFHSRSVNKTTDQPTIQPTIVP